MAKGFSGGLWSGWLQRVREARRNRQRREAERLAMEKLEERQMMAVTSLPQEFWASEATPLAVASGGVNGDAWADLVVLNEDGSLQVALNEAGTGWQVLAAQDLGISDPQGLSLGEFNQDGLADVVVQTADGLVIGLGQGDGSFALSQSLDFGTPGALASSDEAPLSPAIGYLDSDYRPDIAVVVPGSDAVWWLSGEGDGTFTPREVLPSGGTTPQAIAIGNVIGDPHQDLIVGHGGGTLTFFEGNAGGAYAFRSDLTISGQGEVTAVAVADLDGDGDQDLLVSGTDRVTALLNADDPAPETLLLNGDFSAGLTGWTASEDSVQVVGEVANLYESSTSLLSTLEQSFVVPEGATSISFDLVALGLESSTAIPDAFEVSLLNAAHQSLVPTFHPEATSFFNVGPDGLPRVAAGVTIDGTRVTLDLSSLTPGTEARLVFDLVGNPPGLTSLVRIDSVELLPDTRYAESFTAISLPGPWTGATNAILGEVDGDGVTEIVVADLQTLRVFEWNGSDGFLADSYDFSEYGAGATSLTVGPFTDDGIDDVAVSLQIPGGVLSPLPLLNDVAPTVSLVEPSSSPHVGTLAEVVLAFSEPVRNTGASDLFSVEHPEAYRLIEAGANGTFGDSDDVTIDISTFIYSVSTDEITLSFLDTLEPGSYRLEVATPELSGTILDLAGQRLEDGLGAVFFFEVLPIEIEPEPETGIGCGPMIPPEITGILRDDGGDPSDGLTSDRTLVIVGTAAPQSVVYVGRDDIGTLGWTVADLDGHWSFDYTQTSLVDGNYTFTAMADSTGPLGIAGDFDLFVLEDLDANGTDVGGRVAVGGNAILTGYGVASAIGSLGERDGLIVEGDLTFNSGQVYQGNVAVGGTPNVAGAGHIYTGALRQESRIDFDEAATYLEGKSLQLAGLTANGTTTYQWGGVYLDGSDATLNIFEVSAAQLASSWGVQLSVPSGSTVLINVTGTTASLQNMGISLGGLNPKNVLWNFSEATTLTLQGIQVPGSLLAPFAALNFQNGHIDGQLIVRSFTGNGEVHHVPFEHDCPPLPIDTFAVEVEGPAVTIIPRYFVVDAAAEAIFYYDPTGATLGQSDLAEVPGTIVGVATDATGERVWVLDSLGMITQYDADGSYRGQWQAVGLNDPTDVAVLGSDLWIVDAGSDQLLQFTDGTDLRSGGWEANTTFSLDASNLNATGLAARDGLLWVTDDGATTDHVFVYEAASGWLMGSWTLAAANADPTGITLDPAGGENLWVVDAVDGLVYRYDPGSSLRSGTGVIAGSWSLAAGNLQPAGIADPPGEIQLDQVVNGQIDLPLEEDEYTFTLTETQKVFFDVLQGNVSQMRWTLAGPDGQPLAEFTHEFFRDQEWLELAAGTYTLTVQGVGSSYTGAYSFQLVDVPATTITPIVAEAIVSGSLDLPGEEDAFTFTATAGNQLFLDRLSGNTFFIDWILTDPTGQELYQGNSGDLGPLLLTTTGTYTLTLDGEGDTLGAYSFRFFEFPDPTPTPIALDQEVVGEFTMPGEFEIYSFDLVAGDRIFVDHVSGNELNVDWWLTDPTGQELYRGYSFDIGPFDITTAGTYTLTIDGRGDFTGPYVLEVATLPENPPVTIGVGQTIEASIGRPGEEDMYLFTVEAGKVLYFDAQQGNGINLQWSLQLPNGTSLFAGNFHDHGPLTFSAEGIYRLTVDGNGGWQEDYRFRLHDVPQNQLLPLTFGETYAGWISVPGESQTYTFSANAGDLILPEVVAGHYIRMNWYLTAPSGTQLFGGNINAGDRILLDESGEYQLRLDADFDATEFYSFRIHAVPPTVPQPLVVDAPTTAALDQPGEILAYTFTATAGDPFFLDILHNQTYGGNATNPLAFSLVAPSGTVLAQNIRTSTALPTLSETGEYTLLVDQTTAYPHRPIATGLATFRLTPGTVATPWQDPFQLEITDFTTPHQVVGDPASIDLSWTVTNSGPGTIDGGWVDRVYLSSDEFFQPEADQLLGSFAQPSDLLAGESYTGNLTVTLPAGLEGEVFLFVEVDGEHFLFKTPNPNLLISSSVAVYRELPEAGSRPQFALDQADGSSFPAEEPLLLSGQASSFPGVVNAIFIVDFSSSTTFVTGLDANFDGVVDAADDINGDNRIGDILDVELGATLKVAQELNGQVGALNLAFIGFASTAEPFDLTSAPYWQTFIDLQQDSNRDGISDFEEVIREGNHRSTYLGTGTNFAGAMESLKSLLQRQPTADRTQVFMLTDGQAAEPGATLLQEIASFGIEFHGFQITGEAVSNELKFIVDQIDAHPGSRGTGQIVSDPEDLQEALLANLRIAAVTVNGVPVDSLDAAGRFFLPVELAPGENSFEIVVYDENGGRREQTLTLYGLDDGNPDDIYSQLEALPGSTTIGFSGTFFNRETGVLHVDSQLHHDGTTSLDAPVWTSFTSISPLAVTLASAEGLDERLNPFILFDQEIPGGELLTGQSSEAISLAFANPSTNRFSVDVALRGLPNTPPRFTSPPATQAQPDAPYIYSVTVADTESSELVLEIVSAPGGMTLDPNTGELSWTPTAGDVGNHEITLLVTDKKGATAQQTFTLSVAAPVPNRPPRFVTPPPTSGMVNQAVFYQAEVFEPEGEAVTFTLVDGPAGATFGESSGYLSFTPTAAGSYAFTLEVSDPHGATAQQTFVLTVEGAPTATTPVFQSSPPTVASVGQPYLYLAFAQGEDGFQYELLQGPAGMEVDPDTGQLTWTPTAGEVGTHSVLLAAVASPDVRATQFFQIEVAAAPINQPPVITSHPLTQASIDRAYLYQPTAVDPEGSSLTWDLLTGPAGLSVNADSGQLIWQPGSMTLGSHRIELIVSDHDGGTAQQAFWLEVLPPNNAPTIDSGTVEVTAGNELVYDLQASDPDGDLLRFGLLNPLKQIRVSPDKGQLFWLTNNGDIGVYEAIVQAIDSRGDSDQATITINVVADADPPEVGITLNNYVAQPGEVITVFVSAQDNVGIESLQLTADGQVVPLDPQHQYHFLSSTPGLTTFEVTATDPSGNTATATTTLRTLDPNDTTAPLISILGPQPGSVVTYLTEITGSVTDPNLEFYQLQYNLPGTSQWITFAEGTTEVVDGVLGTFDPTVLARDAYDLRVFAQDISGNQYTLEIPRISVEGGAVLGEFSLDITDLSIPLAGIPITVSRHYSTYETHRPGDFGVGWSLGMADAHIRETVPQNPFEEQNGLFSASPFTAGTRIYLTGPDGQRAGYTFEPELVGTGLIGPIWQAKFTADPGVYATLTVDDIPLRQNSDGTFSLYFGGFAFNPREYTLTTKDGTAYRYDQFEGLQTVTDRQGNQLTYTESGIYHSSGASVQFVRDEAGRITQVIDPDGGVIQYTYSEQGDLIRVEDQVGNITSLWYHDDRPHYLEEMSQPGCGCAGTTFVRTEFDEQGRIVAQYDASGNAVTTSYDLQAQTETVADSLGNVSQISYDQRGNITAIVDPLGNRTEYTYDDQDNLLTLTDARGFVTSYTYDARGNVLTILDAEGGSWSYTYNATNDLTDVVDALGRSTHFTMDAYGNVTQIEDAAGTFTYFAYDGSGRMTAMTDRNGLTTTFTYGLFAEPTQVTYADGSTISLAYNYFGLPTEMIDENGNLNTMLYDEQGRLLSITDALGEVTSFTWDAQLISSVTDRLGRVTQYFYDEQDRLIEMIDAEGGSTTYQYDANSRLIETIDPIGRRTTSEYDAAGRLIASTLFAAPGTLGPASATMQYEYDEVGNVLATIDALGNRSTFSYDGLQRLLSQTDPLGQVESFGYDAVGNLLSMTDARGATWSYSYDLLDRLLVSTDPLSGTTSRTYDAIGNLLSLTDPNANTTFYEYDDRYRLTTITDALGESIQYSYDDAGNLATVTDRRGYTTSYTYDALHRLTAMTNPLLDSQQFAYDAEGNLTQWTDELGRSWTYTYDDLNRLLTTTDPLSGQDQYSYNAVGQLLAYTDANSHTTSFEYNLYSQVARLTDALGGQDFYQHDAAGNVLSATDANGHTTSYSYDALHRLTTVTDALGYQTHFSYDANSNLTAFTDQAGSTTNYQYDLLNRLTSITDSLGYQDWYAYDAAGNLTAYTDANGHATQYTYDALHRLASVVDALGHEEFYQHDASGNLLSFTDANGHATAFTYDALSRLTTMTDALGYQRHYAYDATSNLLAFTDQAGSTTNYQYDALDRVTSITDPLGYQVSYGYDANSNLTSFTDEAGYTTTFQYDALDRQTQTVNPLGGIFETVYDAVGNVVQEIDELGRTTGYVYDPLNRMIEIHDPRSTLATPVVTTLSYDGVGNLLSLTDPLGQTTEYEYDSLHRLILSRDPRQQTTTYAYDPVGNLTETIDRNGRRTTFSYDDLDRLLTESWWQDTTEVNRIDLSYDPVGNLLSASDAFSHYTFTYDDLDRLTTTDNTGTPGLPQVVLSYTYDAVGNTLAVNDNLGVQQSSTYNPRHELLRREWSGLPDGAEARLDFDYDSRGLLESISRFGNLQGQSLAAFTQFDHDELGRLTDLTHTDPLGAILADYDYQYNAAHELIQESHHGETIDYTYDPAGQLLSAISDLALPDEQYAYDENGNRTGEDYDLGENNQLDSDGVYDYQYDHEGNLIRRTEIATGEYTLYAYDHRNRLVEAEIFSAGGILLKELSYTYDLFDRLIARTVDDDGEGPQEAKTTFTVYDGQHAWADFDENGDVLARYLYGDQIDELLARWRPTEGIAFYLTDHLGTVRDLVDTTGELLTHYDYTAFGLLTNITNPAFADRFTYTGREFDPHLNLYYYRARWYDAATARFLSQDPLAFTAGDTNLYRYVGNSPLNATDPTGNVAMSEYRPQWFGGIFSASNDVDCEELNNQLEQAEERYKNANDEYRAAKYFLQLADSDGQRTYGKPWYRIRGRTTVGRGYFIKEWAEAQSRFNEAQQEQHEATNFLRAQKNAYFRNCNPNYWDRRRASRSGLPKEYQVDKSELTNYREGVVKDVGTFVIGFIPVAGEAADFAVIIAPESTLAERGIAAGSLGINIVLAGFAPNFGAAAGRLGKKTLLFSDDPLVDSNVLIQASHGNPNAIIFLQSNRGLISFGRATRNEFLKRASQADLSSLIRQHDVIFDNTLNYSDVISDAKLLREAFLAADQGSNQARVLQLMDSRQLSVSRLSGIDFVTNDLKLFKRAKDLGMNVHFLDLFPGASGPSKAARKAASYIPNSVNVPLP
ncbi:Hypothetical protein PBC10988_35090 [Planctomycetales bacterium 10988]|nr:Hypothetical protein PBC10988_35090 [Planctomycetales bacterium 10988]